MSSFNSKNGYDGGGALEQMIAKIQEIKASPKTGHQRLVVREKDKSMKTSVIDVEMKHVKELSEKETYMFNVREKDSSRNPGHQRQRSASLKAYECEGKPEDYKPGMTTGNSMFNRFGGGGGSGKSTKGKL